MSDDNDCEGVAATAASACASPNPRNNRSNGEPSSTNAVGNDKKGSHQINLSKKCYTRNGCSCGRNKLLYPPSPPVLLRRAYQVNLEWKSVTAKACVVVYMARIWLIIWKQSNPWYEFFFYLTLQGWTLELIYFTYALYLDLLARRLGGSDKVSRIAKAAAQALSEVVFAVQVVIVLFFWCVIYPQEGWRSIRWELNCHGVGLLLIVADYVYRFTSFSLRNHRYVLAFAAMYTVWYAFIVRVLRRSVYPGIDFRTAKSVIIFTAGLSTVILTHKIVYLITNWPWIKEDLKSVIGIGQVLLMRQDSFEILSTTMGFQEIGAELLSINPHCGSAGPFQVEEKRRERCAVATSARIAAHDETVEDNG